MVPAKPTGRPRDRSAEEANHGLRTDERLPVNRARCPVHHYHKGGYHKGRPMRIFEPLTGPPNAYDEPNSFSGPRRQ